MDACFRQLRATLNDNRLKLAYRTKQTMHTDDLRAATERLNAGAEIPNVEPSLIEYLWEAISRIPREKRKNTAIGLGVFARGDPNRLPQNPELHVAMMVRYALLDALIERGILREYMENESLRKKVFVAAASFPCNKNDLSEALAQRVLRESPPDIAQKVIEEFRQAGYDPDNPQVAGRFIVWLRDNC